MADGERFGFLGIKGPLEKRFGGRRPGESRKEWLDRIERQAREGANKKKRKKKKRAQKDKGARRATIAGRGGQQTSTVITRDMALVEAVDDNEEAISGLAADLAELNARVEVIEEVQQEGQETITVLGGGLGNIIAFLDPIVVGINAADQPVIPFAAQASAFLRAWSASMGDGMVFGLGKSAVQALAMVLTIVAYWDQTIGLQSLFQTDQGGLIAGGGTTTTTTTGGGPTLV